MNQLGKSRSILYHLYPGIFITLGFIIITPIVIRFGFPPQFGMLLSIVIVAIPVLLLHLLNAKKRENKNHIFELNGLSERLSAGKLILYSFGLVVFAFLIWGGTQPLNKIVTEKCLNWLPEWYTVQDFEGYSKNKIIITLIFNLLINGFLAPFIEEYYFRGYLLPRMNSWGKSAFIVNTVLFSLYHLWQPYIYLTLIFALLPMVYVTWKTKDLRLAILTHCLLNIIGAILAFGLLMQK
jgi:uncharacterized protein